MYLHIILLPLNLSIYIYIYNIHNIYIYRERERERCIGPGTAFGSDGVLFSACSSWKASGGTACLAPLV